MTPKRRTLATLCLALLLGGSLAACSAGGGAGSQPLPGVVAGDAGSFAKDQAIGPELMPGGSMPDASQRSVIRTGEATITVADPAAAADEVARIATEQHGSVDSRSVDRGASGAEGGAASASLTIRVPEDRLDQTFEALSGVGRVVHESRSENDVTLQHTDLQARVKALQTSVDRLNELLASSASTSDLIEVENALAQRQQELDGLRAQLTALDDQVSYATVWVSLSTDAVIPGGPSNFWEGLLLGLRSMGTAAAGAVIALGVALPWLVVLGLVAGVIVWLSLLPGRRRRRIAPAATANREPGVEQGPAGGADEAR